MESSNSRAVLPRELHPSQNPGSPATNRYTPGVVVDDGGLSLRGFGSRKALVEDARGTLESSFSRTIIFMKHDPDPQVAIFAIRKFAVLMRGLNERQLWFGLEALKEVSSSSERGNELRFNASQLLDHVESELWIRLGVFAETGRDKRADPEARENAFKMMEWLYPRLSKHLADQTKPKNAVVGDAQEDGKVAAGLPAWDAKAIRLAMEEAAKARASSMSAGALEIEQKMAYAILTIIYRDQKVDKRVFKAAFHAFETIDSPAMTKMITEMESFELGGRDSAAPLANHPEFELDELEPMMIIHGPGDRD